MSRIAVDAMGGDHAPRVVVDGSVSAAKRQEDVEIALVGPEERLAAELARHGDDVRRIEIVHAPEVVEMHESPVEALRGKPRSSIRVMTSLLKEGQCDAIFSAGNTGAMVAASTLGLGLLPGVRRAGIAVTIPVGDRLVLLIDAGANIQCKPLHLFQYGVMAAEFISRVYGVESPGVGLLNVGEEEQKGNKLVKETRDLFRGSSLRYLGNVEGGDIFQGECDVVVCDGFVGNIVLKVAEGLSEQIMGILFESFSALAGEESGGSPFKDDLRRFAASLDYAEYGGAPLLGVDGIALIGHGRSDEKAVANALRWAHRIATARINECIVEAVKGTDQE